MPKRKRAGGWSSKRKYNTWHRRNKENTPSFLEEDVLEPSPDLRGSPTFAGSMGMDSESLLSFPGVGESLIIPDECQAGQSMRSSSPIPNSAEAQSLWKEYFISPSSGALKEKNDSNSNDGELLNASGASGSSISHLEGVLRSSTPLKDLPSFTNESQASKALQCSRATTSSSFIVTEMSISSGIVPQIRSFFEEVRHLIINKLPTSWDVSTCAESLFVRKCSTPKCSGPVQRSVMIREDGSVTLQMHCVPISPDHVIWQQLPHAADFNLRSVSVFSAYVLKVVAVFRTYDVCIGNPEPQLATFAKRVPGAVYDQNIFKENRYKCTYRSSKCHLILPVQKKFCPRCYDMREALKKRQKRASVSVKTPLPVSSIGVI